MSKSDKDIEKIQSINEKLDMIINEVSLLRKESEIITKKFALIAIGLSFLITGMSLLANWYFYIFRYISLTIYAFLVGSGALCLVYYWSKHLGKEKQT